MTNFTWTFLQFDTYSDAKRDDVVASIHWSVAASDGERQGVRAGTVSLGAPSDDFVPFEKLTPEWAQKKVLEAMPDCDLEKEAEERMGPAAPVVTSKLPPFADPPKDPQADMPRISLTTG